MRNSLNFSVNFSLQVEWEKKKDGKILLISFYIIIITY